MEDLFEEVVGDIEEGQGAGHVREPSGGFRVRKPFVRGSGAALWVLACTRSHETISGLVLLPAALATVGDTVT
jgi:hypothetical protein